MVIKRVFYVLLFLGFYAFLWGQDSVVVDRHGNQVATAASVQMAASNADSPKYLQRFRDSGGVIVDNSKVDFDGPEFNTMDITYNAGDFTIGSELDGAILKFTVQIEGITTGNNRSEINFEIWKNGVAIDRTRSSNYAFRNTSQNEGGVALPNYLMLVATNDVYHVQVYEVGADPTYLPSTRITIEKL